jgi:hypothetical protein
MVKPKGEKQNFRISRSGRSGQSAHRWAGLIAAFAARKQYSFDAQTLRNTKFVLGAALCFVIQSETLPEKTILRSLSLSLSSIKDL